MGLRAGWSKSGTLHLTLRFLGDVEDDRLEPLIGAVGRAAMSVGAFEFVTTSLGAFPSPRRPRVLWLGVESDHIPVRTSAYTGIAQREEQVRVDGLDYVTTRFGASDRLLLVDDVYDTGLSLQQVIAELAESFGSDMPETRIATPWFKPGNNLTRRNPDYFLHESDEWLVFPHELDGLNPDELRDHKPALSPIINALLSRLQGRQES